MPTRITLSPCFDTGKFEVAFGRLAPPASKIKISNESLA
jgi:hypothetical protein